MKARVVPAPHWLRRVVPAAAAVAVLGTRDGEPHVVSLTAPDGTRQVYKHYRDGCGRHAARTMRAVQRALLARGTEAALAVPTVRRWHARDGVLVQTAAAGRALLPVLATSQQRDGLDGAASALAALHTSGARVGRVTTMPDHVADLIHPHPTVVARAVPMLARRIHRLTESLVRWQATSPLVTVVPLHRDAHPRQMTLDGRRVWLVDWDLAARGDAALDVANFALYLRTRLPSTGARAADSFVRAYLAYGADVRERLEAFTACMALRLLCKTWRLRRPGWRARMVALLAVAEDAAERAGLDLGESASPR